MQETSCIQDSRWRACPKVPANDPDKRFYGAITVSDRGQIVIPAQARRDFGIEVGDKLLVFGDLRHGIAIAKADEVIARHPGTAAILDGGGS